MPVGNSQFYFKWRLNSSGGIYSKDGSKVKNKDAKNAIEALVNSNIRLLKDYLNESAQSDDW